MTPALHCTALQASWLALLLGACLCFFLGLDGQANLLTVLRGCAYHQHAPATLDKLPGACPALRASSAAGRSLPLSCCAALLYIPRAQARTHARTHAGKQGFGPRRMFHRVTALPARLPEKGAGQPCLQPAAAPTFVCSGIQMSRAWYCHEEQPGNQRQLRGAACTPRQRVRSTASLQSGQQP